MNTLRNNVQLIGNLGMNPEVKTLDNGKKMAKFSIACNESYKDAKGKTVENTSWFNLVAWEGLAEVAEKYLHKGKQVAVCGKLVTKSYTDKQGVKRTSTEIVLSELMMLGSKKD